MFLIEKLIFKNQTFSLKLKNCFIFKLKSLNFNNLTLKFKNIKTDFYLNVYTILNRIW